MNKVCTKCKINKPLDQFTKKSKSKDGLDWNCKSCKKHSSIKYYNANKDTILESNKKYYKNNKKDILEYRKDYNINWCSNNKEKVKKNYQNFINNNPNHYRYCSAKRRAAKKERTVSWANRKAIKEFYKNCPKGYHVDHIIPLRGKNISGLHVLSNLQYLPAEDNLKKSNKFEG